MSFALGVAAALVAPLLMVVGFIVWDNHWSASAFSLNMFKCLVASGGFFLCSVLTRLPSGAVFSSEVFTQETVGFLLLSSTIGLILGDWTWLEGLRVLGARKVIVLDSLKPFFAAVVGRIFLGETLRSGACLGLLCTALGVLLVGLERAHEDAASPRPPAPADAEASAAAATETAALLETRRVPRPAEGEDAASPPRRVAASYAAERRRNTPETDATAYGLCMGILNVVLHTFGALLTKLYGGDMNTWEINLVRFGFAGVMMLLCSLLMQLRQKLARRAAASKEDEDADGRTTITTEKDTATPWYALPAMPTSWWARICAGVALVSFLTPALTNYAMFQVALALLLTLESVGPLYSLPLCFLLEDETPSLRASLGAVLAVAGIAILAACGDAETAG